MARNNNGPRSQEKRGLAEVYGIRRTKRRLRREVEALQHQQSSNQAPTADEQRVQQLAKSLLGAQSISDGETDGHNGNGHHRDASEFLVTLGLTPEQVDLLVRRLAELSAENEPPVEPQPAPEPLDPTVASEMLKSQRAEEKRLRRMVSGLQRERQQLEELIAELREKSQVDRETVNAQVSSAVSEVTQQIQGQVGEAILGQAEEARNQIQIAVTELSSQLRNDFSASIAAQRDEATAQMRAAAREASAALQESADALKVQLEQIVSSNRDAVRTEVQRIGDATVEAVRESTQELRGQIDLLVNTSREAQDSIRLSTDELRNELRELVAAARESTESLQSSAREMRTQLDSLLQQALDLSGKVARLDADLRSREWLSRLLTLIEGRGELAPVEVKTLALNMFDSFRVWSDQHPEATPPEAVRELERVMSKFRDWRP